MSETPSPAEDLKNRMRIAYRQGRAAHQVWRRLLALAGQDISGAHQLVDALETYLQRGGTREELQALALGRTPGQAPRWHEYEEDGIPPGGCELKVNGTGDGEIRLWLDDGQDPAAHIDRLLDTINGQLQDFERPYKRVGPPRMIAGAAWNSGKQRIKISAPVTTS